MYSRAPDPPRKQPVYQRDGLADRTQSPSKSYAGRPGPGYEESQRNPYLLEGIHQPHYGAATAPGINLNYVEPGHRSLYSAQYDAAARYNALYEHRGLVAYVDWEEPHRDHIGHLITRNTLGPVVDTNEGLGVSMIKETVSGGIIDPAAIRRRPMDVQYAPSHPAGAPPLAALDHGQRSASLATLGPFPTAGSGMSSANGSIKSTAGGRFVATFMIDGGQVTFSGCFPSSVPAFTCNTATLNYNKWTLTSTSSGSMYYTGRVSPSKIELHFTNGATVFGLMNVLDVPFFPEEFISGSGTWN